MFRNIKLFQLIDIFKIGSQEVVSWCSFQVKNIYSVISKPGQINYEIINFKMFKYYREWKYYSLILRETITKSAKRFTKELI